MTTKNLKVNSRPQRQQVNKDEALSRIRVAQAIANQNTADLIARRQGGQC